jgi:hypothetical protein
LSLLVRQNWIYIDTHNPPEALFHNLSYPPNPTMCIKRLTMITK